MTRIEGEIVIGRPVDVVFDNIADQRNEPRFNLRMVRAAVDGNRIAQNLASEVARSTAA
jgi:hypothetical protein